MKRILIIAIASVVLISMVYSQYDAFDLSGYQLPDYTKHSLWGRLSGNNQIRRDNDHVSTTNNAPDIDRSSNFNGELNYLLQKGTREYQRSLQMEFAFSTNLQNGENQNSTYFNSRISPELHIDNSYRRFMPGGMYAETDIVIDLDYTRFNSAHEYLTTDNNNRSGSISNDMNVYFPVKIGHGRIEMINDATRAIYIFQALDKADRLSVEVDDKDIIDLANLITDMRNRTVFDTRLSTMEKLEDLDRFLIIRSMIKQADARYFVTLDDMWRYSHVGDRYAGRQYAFVLRPGISINYDKDLIREEYENDRITVIDAGVEYRNQKPISLKWQESIEACFYTAYNNVYRFRTRFGSLYRDQLMNFNMSVERQYTYYPNTRTEISFILGAAYANGLARLGDNAEWLFADTQLLHGMAKMNMYYYITPKLSLNVNALMEYLWAGKSYNDAIPLERPWRNYSTSLEPDSNDQHRFNSNISLSINYSIF